MLLTSRGACIRRGCKIDAGLLNVRAIRNNLVDSLLRTSRHRPRHSVHLLAEGRRWRNYIRALALYVPLHPSVLPPREELCRQVRLGDIICCGSSGLPLLPRRPRVLHHRGDQAVEGGMMLGVDGSWGAAKTEMYARGAEAFTCGVCRHVETTVLGRLVKARMEEEEE